MYFTQTLHLLMVSYNRMSHQCDKNINRLLPIQNNTYKFKPGFKICPQRRCELEKLMMEVTNRNRKGGKCCFILFLFGLGLPCFLLSFPNATHFPILCCHVRSLLALPSNTSDQEATIASAARAKNSWQSRF